MVSLGVNWVYRAHLLIAHSAANNKRSILEQAASYFPSYLPPKPTTRYSFPYPWVNTADKSSSLTSTWIWRGDEGSTNASLSRRHTSSPKTLRASVCS